MIEAEGYSGSELTRHRALERRYGGRTARDWWRFYGLIAVLWFLLVLTYTRYLELFDNIEQQSAGYQAFVMCFSGSGLLVLVPAMVAFIWWAAGALVRYSLWQRGQPVFWRWFWVVVLVFYTWVEFDPLDAIHPVMSHKGLGNAPNLVAMFEASYRLSDGIPLEKFQWGYFLLWALFWFLLVTLHWQYLLNGLRESWFYVLRFHRYGASVLTGFRETARVARRPAVTFDYPKIPPVLPPAFRGVPRLNVNRLSAAQAAAIIAADGSGAISAAADQPTVLFVDLGRYCYSPTLAEVANEQGEPLLSFSARWAAPAVDRANLVVPLGAAAVSGPEPGEETVASEPEPAVEAGLTGSEIPPEEDAKTDTAGGESQ